MTESSKKVILNKLRDVDFATLCNLLESANLSIKDMTEVANGDVYSDTYRNTARQFCEGVKEYRELITIVINEKN